MCYIEQLLENGKINDKVVAQAGNAECEGRGFKEIFSFTEDFEAYVDAAEIVITADGAGTIFQLLNKGKKIIVVDNKLAAKYGAPASDFVGGFEEAGYLLWCRDHCQILDYIVKARKIYFKKYKPPDNNIYKEIYSAYEDWLIKA